MLTCIILYDEANEQLRKGAELQAEAARAREAQTLLAARATSGAGHLQ